MFFLEFNLVVFYS